MTKAAEEKGRKKGTRKVKRTVPDGKGNLITVEDTLDLHEGDEETLPGAPGAGDDIEFEPSSAVEELRAAYGESDLGNRIALSKFDSASASWCWLQDISTQEAKDREAIKAIGKGDGKYKIEVTEDDVVRFVKYVNIGIPQTSDSNPLTQLAGTLGKSGGDNMGAVVLIMGQVMQASQEQNRLTMESAKTDMQWKMAQLEKETALKIETMKDERAERAAREEREREERRAERERQDKAFDRQMNLILTMSKKDDTGTLLLPMLSFVEKALDSTRKFGQQETSVLDIIKEALPAAAALIDKAKKPAQATPQPGLPPAAASFSSGDSPGFVTAGAPSGNGGGSAPSPAAPGIDLNVVKQQIESNALPMLFQLAETAMLEQTPEGQVWGPKEEHDPAYVAGSLYVAYKQSYPGMSREQFGSLIRTVVGTEQQFFQTYPKTLEHEAWFRDFYREITLIEDDAPQVEVVQ